MWKCEECGGELIEDTGGIFLCKICGVIHDKTYSAKEDPIYNTGTKTRHHEVRDSHYTTKINLDECKDTNLKRILKRSNVRNWNFFKTDLVRIEIRRICSLLNFSNIIDDCFHLFEKIKKNTSFSRHGGTMEEVARSIVYLQVRLYGKPILLHDFEKVGVSKKNIIKYYMEWVEKFKFKVKLQTPKLIVVKIVNSLIKDDFRTFRDKFLLIRDSTQLAKKNYYLGNYIIVCGACVYIKSKEFGFEITQKQISDVIGCWPQTLRRSIQKISN